MNKLIGILLTIGLSIAVYATTQSTQRPITDQTLSVSDTTTNDVSTTKHGFAPKITDTSALLKGDGTWTKSVSAMTIAGSTISGTTTLKDTLNATSNLVMTSGKGIDFSATANASGTTTSELFDDYEYGVWNPFYYGTSSAGTGTYSVSNGTYVKFGKGVLATFSLVSSSHTGTGNIRFGGLPYPAASTSNYTASCAIGSSSNLTVPSGRYPTAYIGGGSSFISLEANAVSGGSSIAVSMDTSFTFYSTCMYSTD